MDPSVVDPLYDLPARDFVAARNALAKELRAGGDKEAAAAVAKLRRPSGTAWALNQIARHQADLLARALEAKGDLRDVTEGTGRGEDLDLRSATIADREATRAVVAAARTLLGNDDPGLANRITSTLLAAVLDPEVDAVVRTGRLSSEQDASAFSLASEELADVIVLADRAPRKPVAAPKSDGAARQAAEDERRRRREQADRQRAVERLESRLARLEEKAVTAEAEAVAARAEAEEAAAELAIARGSLDAP